MPQVKPVYLQSVSGLVDELMPPHKAVVVFLHDGFQQRALLWTDKLMINGRAPIAKEDVRDQLEIGTKLTFKCHALDASGRDACNWFIVTACRQEAQDKVLNDFYHFGIVNGTGTATVLNPRQGVLSFEGNNGSTEMVLFQASKIYLYEKRPSSKKPIDLFMHLGDEYFFDAIPINQNDNEHNCSWFATIVWKGSRPEDTKVDDGVDLLTDLKTVANNPKGMFLRGYGHVWSVMNSDYALLLVRFKPNHYEIVLLHASFCSWFHKMNNLNDLLKKGDRLQIVAVPAPEKFLVQWIASNVSPDLDGYQKDCFNTVA